MESTSDSSVDHELELVLQLSKKTYEEEEQRRRLEEEFDNLINLEDQDAKKKQEQIENITRLFNKLPPPRPLSGVFECTSSSSSSHAVDWNNSSSVPLNYLMNGRNNNLYRSTSVYQAGEAFRDIPTNSTLRPRTLQHNISAHVNDSSLQWSGSDQSVSQCSHNIPVFPSPVVPFQPIASWRLNGDLIDLGHDTVSDAAPSEPLSYEQIREEFDPLCRPNVSVNSGTDASVMASTSGLTSSKSTSFLNDQQSLDVQEHSEAPSSTASTASVGQRDAAVTKPGRPPPPKPQRQMYKRSGSAGSCDRLNSMSGGYLNFSVASLHLEKCKCELDREIALLTCQKASKDNPSTQQFISPVADYLTTNFKVTSVKVIVEKDYSWPRKGISETDDRIVFTCETQSTVQEILVNVLGTFLETSVIEAYGGRLPVDEYGLKIYGLDEFLLNSSQLGENPFVGEALAFGRDILLEVGKLNGSLALKPIRELDISNIKKVKRTTSSNISATRRHPSFVTADSVQEIIETLKRSVLECITNSSQGNVAKRRNAVKQIVKLMCTHMGGIMHNHLSLSLTSFLASSSIEQLHSCARRLAIDANYLIDAVSRSCRCDFAVPALKDSSSGSSKRIRREIVGFDGHLKLLVESIHNVPLSWQEIFRHFFVVVHVMHGTAELCRGIRSSLETMSRDVLFPYCPVNASITFDLPLCVLPRETRLFILLYGVLNEEQISGHSANDAGEEKPEPAEKLLAYASFPIFNFEGFLRQGPLLVPLSLVDSLVVQSWGPRPLYEPGDLCALIMLPTFQWDIVFSAIGFGVAELSRDFSSLGQDTQQWLMDIIETGVTHSLSQDEKEILWEKRYYLTGFPQALTLVLASAIGWDWASLNNVYQMVDEWAPLDPVQAVELLLPHFPDLEIRKRSIQWLQKASSDFIFNFLPELVEALRFETYENSPLALYLLSLCASGRRFAFELYWQLQQRIDHCPERWFVYRCAILQDKIFDAMDENMHMDIKNQRLLLEALNTIAADVKDCGGENMKKNLDWLDASILANNVRLPIMPSFLCSGINVHECSFFSSLTKPLKISFKGLKTSYDVLYKVGDDVRQDALVLQLVRIMNDIWLSQELDLRMIVFRCMPVGKKAGMIELVSECRTLCEIQSALGATGVFKDDILKKWLEKQNPTEFQYKIALENFQLSCAGWCVATYVLGIGDRHNDNILITKSGHVFHIDFGKYMGDWQTAAGFRRDRTPFIFTAEMAYVINEGSQQSATDKYQHFVDNCCKAFNLLRKNYSLLVTLIKLMSCSGIPGMGMDAVSFVQNNLLLDVSDTEATVQFTKMIQESLKSKFPRLNFFAHTLVQLKNSSFIRGSYDDPDKLSFVPETYSERSDGRISNVIVLAFEKWRTPEKVYMYKIRVERINEAVSSIVYRSFEEFSELYVKLCQRFNMVRLPVLSRGTGIGRSNIRAVAERRRPEIQQFLTVLFDDFPEVAHCDLVYTFFHIIYRDSDPEESNRCSQSKYKGEKERPSLVTGRIYLNISYDQQKSILSVFVGHVQGLHTVNGQAPDSYVKTYLLPSMKRSTKRKTRVVKNTQTPTFNEELTYRLVPECCLSDYSLEVSVWNYGSIVSENLMIGAVLIPLHKLDLLQVNRKGIKTYHDWFELNGFKS